MSIADLKHFCTVYFASLLVIAVLSLVLRRPELDEFDYLHVLIIAATSTILRAVHAQGDKP